jgi:hypothetical protein
MDRQRLSSAAKDYRVGFERTGDGGATGNHIHFEFRNNAAAERFAAMAGGGRVLGLNTADGGPAVAAGSGSVPQSAARCFTGRLRPGHPVFDEQRRRPIINSVKLGASASATAAARAI